MLYVKIEKNEKIIIVAVSTDVVKHNTRLTNFLRSDKCSWLTLADSPQQTYILHHGSSTDLVVIRGGS